MSRLLKPFAPILAAVVSLTLMAVAQPARADWLRAESTHFVLYSDGDEASLRDYARRLEIYDAILRAGTGVPADRPAGRKLPIYLVGGASSLRQVQPGLPDGVGGFYTASSEAIYAIGVRSRREDFILFHEYAHHFMFQHFPVAYPAWYVEGFAEYYMTTEIDGDAITVGVPNDARAAFINPDRWLPYRLVLARRSGEVSSIASERIQYYAQAWLLTHWLHSDPERAAWLQAYLTAVNAGGDPVTSLEQASGLSVDQIEAALRSYARGGLPTVRAESTLQSQPLQISQLPAVYDDLLLLSLSLTRSLQGDDRAEVLDRVRRAAARHPGDGFARLTLGHAELHFGDRTAGTETLQQLVLDEPANLDALIYLAVARTEAARDVADPDERARLLGASNAYLARALDIDPEDYRIYQLLAENRVGRAGYPNDNDIQLRLMAWRRAPQLAGVVLGLAEALMTVGRFDEAETVLGPLANNPHGGGVVERASELLALARADQPPTPRRDRAS